MWCEHDYPEAGELFARVEAASADAPAYDWTPAMEREALGSVMPPRDDAAQSEAAGRGDKVVSQQETARDGSVGEGDGDDEKKDRKQPEGGRDRTGETER